MFRNTPACPPPGLHWPRKAPAPGRAIHLQAPPALIEQEWQRFQAADAPGLSKPVSGTEQKWEALLQLRPTSSPVGPARLVGETLFQGRSTEGGGVPPSGVNPEEQHLQIRRDRLWCEYRKSTSRGETQPRPLRLLPCDDWAEGWNLLEKFKNQPLPPMRPGYGAEDLGLYMRRRRRWQELRQDYEAAGEKLVLYSARHGYAHRAHLICELPPKVAAAAMGHSVETHLASYSKWCGDDVVDDAFERAARRLGR